MRGWTIFAAVCLSGAGPAAVQSGLRYHVVHGWPQLPGDEMLDEVSAVAVDGHDDVLVLTRAGRQWPDKGELDTSPIAKPTIFRFDGRTGRLTSRFGAGMFALPHSITVDARQNIWIADVALHQVFKLSPDGRLLLALGTRAVSGEDARHFNRPSDVAIGRDGSIFVSDGYGNNRVAKFDRTGRFLLSWGSKGSAAGQFNLPHGIASDNKGRLCVDDRGNARIQCFNEDGRWRLTLKGPPFASPQDVKFDHSGRLFVVEAGSSDPLVLPGVVVLDGNGRVLERFGRYGNYDGQFVDAHWLAIDSRGAVYVADFGGKRVQKFVRER
jgi:peptidylamidoglycolate lyase